MPHAVRVGLTVHVAGMVPVDSAGRLVAAGDVRGQARQVMTNLVAVMRAARGVPGDVTRVTIYLRDLSPTTVSAVRAEVVAALGEGTPPAMTFVGVTALPEPQMLVMIEATANLRSELPDRTRMGPGVSR